jgi:hypothetical protein
VLKAGGILSMAIPDKRTCFDYFRPISTSGSWLEAFLDKRSRPTLLQLFEHSSMRSEYARNGESAIVFFDAEDPKKVTGSKQVREAYNDAIEMKRSDDDAYRDAHCSVMTASSFSLILLDLTFLGLLRLSIEETVRSGAEFYVHLRNPATTKPKSDAEFYSERQVLLHRVMDECAYNSCYAFDLRQKLQVELNSLVSAQEKIVEIKNALVSAEANLDEIKNSITWKIAGPLWRLETKRQRKEARRRLSATSNQR